MIVGDFLSRRFLLVGLVMLLSSLAWACSPPVTPTAASLSASEVVARAADKMQNVNSFHFDLDQSGGGTPLFAGVEMNQATGDVVKPDKLRVKLNGTFGNSVVELEAISIGPTTYITNPATGKFETLPMGLNPISFFDPATGVKAILSSMSDLTKLDDDTLDGVAAYHLRGKLSASALKPIAGDVISDAPIDTEIWIGKDDFLMRQVRMTGQVTRTEKPGITRTLKLSTYNQPANIQPPS